MMSIIIIVIKITEKQGDLRNMGKRIKMTLQEIRASQKERYGQGVESMGIMALVDVENMGWCKDGVTRWYHFTNNNGKPAVYYKY